MKKRIVTLLLTLVLVIGLLPLAAFATEANDVVYISVSYDGQFMTAPDGSNMAYVPVELEKLKEIDLDAYNMGDYKYDADGDGNYEITALHLYIYSHEKLYGGNWSDVEVSGAPGSIFFGNGLFGMLIAKVGFFNAALMFLGIPLVICTALIILFVKSDRKILKEEALSKVEA